MTTFGVAAFLKIASLNPKPQKTELKKRLFGVSDRAYDFHRSLKLAAAKLLIDGVPLSVLLEAAKGVKNPSEQKSLIAGLTKLAQWRLGFPGDAVSVPTKIYSSPNGVFKISIQPEFGIVNASGRTAFHIWNTKRPDLRADAVYGLLGLLPERYASNVPMISDFSVLSLLEPKLFRLPDKSLISETSIRLIAQVERVILDIYDEFGESPPGPPGPHPPPP